MSQVCGKLFRGVIQGKVQAGPMPRTGLTRVLWEVYSMLEDQGKVPAGTAEEASGISLRAGGVTEAAACGMEKEILAGHGRWKSLSGPESYDRQDKRKFERVSTTLQNAMHQQGRKDGRHASVST